MVVEPSLQDESEFLYTAQPELLKYKTAQLAVEKVIDWYQTRAEEIEHHARQVRASDSCCSAMPNSATGFLRVQRVWLPTVLWGPCGWQARAE